jgi:hypothetical protein
MLKKESKKIIINIFSGQCFGKKTLTAIFFINLKKKGLNIGYARNVFQEKPYLEELDQINNQYYISFKQYIYLNNMSKDVDCVITDCSLLDCLIDNRINQNNVSNIEKTEAMIMEKYNEFENINFLINKFENPKYELDNNEKNECNRKNIDELLLKILEENKIKYEILDLNKYSIEEITKKFIEKIEIHLKK